MAFDEGLADRIRELLAAELGLVEKKMFGGLGFMLDGNMCAGVMGEHLIARVPVEEYAAIMTQPNTQLFPDANRPMRGWVQVTVDGIAEDEDLARWVKSGILIARALPPK